MGSGRTTFQNRVRSPSRGGNSGQSESGQSTAADESSESDRSSRRLEKKQLALDDDLQSRISSSVTRLLSPFYCEAEALKLCPEMQTLAAKIQADAVEIASAIAKLVPDAADLLLKLELVGENRCKRWHQDYYVCRAVVSYNGESATEYVHDQFVDFWELKNCGSNDCVVKPESC